MNKGIVKMPNPVKIRLQPKVYFGQSLCESTKDYQRRLKDANEPVRFCPQSLELSQAKKLHEWLGRLIQYKEIRR